MFAEQRIGFVIARFGSDVSIVFGQARDTDEPGMLNGFGGDVVCSAVRHQESTIRER